MSILTRTTNNFTFRNYHNDSSYLWFVAAQRLQWGYADWIEGGNPVNVTLPLPFPKNDYLIVACAYGGIDNFHTAALNTVTSNITSNAKYQLATYDYNRRYNYIAIGF